MTKTPLTLGELDELVAGLNKLAHNLWFTWDQEAQTAQLTAFQSVRSDLSGLLGALGTGIKPKPTGPRRITVPMKRAPAPPKRKHHK